MKQQKQSGFAHMLIIIILTVALIGALGFVFWQNFLQPKDSVESNTSIPTINNTSVTKAVSYKTYTADKYNISFKYPDTWNVHPVYNDYLKYNQEIDIQNESGVVVAELDLAALGVGGVCPDDAAQANTTVGVEKIEIQSIKPVYFSSIIINNNDGTYLLRYGLSDSYTKNGENSKSCIFAFNFEVKDDPYNSYIAFADGYPGSKTNRTFNSIDEVNQYINNDSEYKEIRKMILSLSN